MENLIVGTFEYSIDTQRRFSVPKSWRDKNDEVFYLLPGKKQEIRFFKASVFNQLFMNVKTNFLLNKNLAYFSHLGSNVSRCKCDGQGKISLTTNLKNYASIKNEIFLIGAFHSALIVSKEQWLKRKNSIEQTVDMFEDVFSNDDLDEAIDEYNAKLNRKDE